MENRRVPPLGSQANAWSAASTGAGGTSAALDTHSCPFVSAFGAVSGATTITLQVSHDNATWYDSQTTQVLAGAADFCVHATVAARYVRLKSSADVTATATLAAKGA